MWLRMLLAGAVAIGLTGFAPAPVPKAQRTKNRGADDMVRLTGMWKVVSYERPGLKAGGVIRTAITNVRIQNGKWAFMREVNNALTPTVEYDLKVDPNGTPKKMDLVRDLNGTVLTMKGIYQFDGEKLKFMYVTTTTIVRPAGAAPVNVINQANTSNLSFEKPPANAILYTLEPVR